MQRMMGMGGGGGGAPSAGEIEKMQAELARLDPKELRDQLPKGLPAGLPGPGGGGRAMPRLPGLPGGAQPFRGLPGLPGKKK
jgi:hypothetical protein